MHCGQVEIDFSDIVSSGYYVDITSDTFLSITNPTLLSKSAISLDPTDTLLPNATNKAYLVSSTATDNPNQATTEFTSTQYGYINTSNNVYTTSTAQETITQTCGTQTKSGCVDIEPDSCECTDPVCTAPGTWCATLGNTTGYSTCSVGTFDCLCKSILHILVCLKTPPACTQSGGCSYFCNSGYFDTDGTDSNGCESSTASYIFEFQRYTFNISSYWTGINNVTFYWEGKYNITNSTIQSPQNSSNLMWYNVTSGSWVSWQNLPYNSENSYTAFFNGNNLTDLYNSTSGLVQFAVRGNQSKTGHTLTISADYAYLNVTYTTGGGAVTPEGDSFYCDIQDFIPSVQSVPTLCSVHSNTTGQPVTGATVTCKVWTSPYFAAQAQAEQTCTEAGAGLYNCTFLSANQAANTCYIINCSTTINTVVNWFAGTTCVSQSFTTSCASTADVNTAATSVNNTVKASWSYSDVSSAIATAVWAAATRTLTSGSGVCAQSSEVTIVNNNILAVGANLTSFANQILTNQTLILNNITLVQGNQTLELNNISLVLGNITQVLGNETLILSNITLIQGNQSWILNNVSLVLGNQTLILGNESTIITNIAYLNGNLSANFTYTNGQIALVLGNQTLILGNETLILTNLADVNATQNVNYAALEALITSLSNLTAQEVWEYFNRTANCSNCGSSTLTAADVWTYISRTLTDYNLTEVISYLGNINNTQVLILGNQSLILGNESIIITNIADLNGNMSANFTYIEGRLTLVLGNQTFILGNETLILTNLATLEGNMSGNFTYTNSLINNLNCSGGNGTGSTVYYLNQTVLADSNVSGMQQWLNFQLLLLLVAIAFTALGIWRHNNVFLSAAGIIFVILGISIISDGINAGVGSIAQQSNYTYNGFAQLTNISASDTYAYSAWKDLASSLAGMILILFGLFLFGYSALYVPMKQRRGE